MTGRRMSRTGLRVAHLGLGVPVVAFFVGPFAGDPALEVAIRLVVLPAVIASGMVMWQLPRWRRLLARRARRAGGPTVALTDRPDRSVRS